MLLFMLVFVSQCLCLCVSDSESFFGCCSVSIWFEARVSVVKAEMSPGQHPHEAVYVSVCVSASACVSVLVFALVFV